MSKQLFISTLTRYVNQGKIKSIGKHRFIDTKKFGRANSTPEKYLMDIAGRQGIHPDLCSQKELSKLNEMI